MDQVMGQLRSARGIAIAQRRNVQVQFVGTNVIQITRLNQPSGTTLLNTVPLQGLMQFFVFTTLPDTPDGFGNASAVYFEGLPGGPTMMLFQSDGTFVDNAGNVINGTVFLGVPTDITTARAVTVMGATGRIRAYRAPSQQWLQ